MIEQTRARVLCWATAGLWWRWARHAVRLGHDCVGGMSALWKKGGVVAQSSQRCLVFFGRAQCSGRSSRGHSMLDKRGNPADG